MKKILFLFLIFTAVEVHAYDIFKNHSWATEDAGIKLLISQNTLTLATPHYSCAFDLEVNQNSFYGTFRISHGRTASGVMSNCSAFENSYPFITTNSQAYLVINVQDFQVFKLNKYTATTAPNPNPNPGTPAQPPGTYTFEEIIPDVFSGFTTLRPGQTSIANVHIDPRTGGSGLPFPNRWNTIVPGQSVRLKVLIPPGVSLVGWRLEAPDLVAHLGVCDSSSCINEKAYPPTIFPYGYNGNLPDATPVENLPALTKPAVGYLSVSALNVNFTFFALAVTYTIKDPVLYENWRKARSWAGGTEDCDGLGGEFCR